MAFDRNVTSANLSATMVVDELFPAGFNLEMFSTDAAITVDAVVATEARMSVDGKLVGGVTPAPKVVTITIEPASPSLPYFVDIVRAYETTLTPFKVELTVTLPAIGRVFTFTNGLLTSYPPMPGAAKTLQPLAFQFTFEGLE
ncbi:MAG: hypothetical protein SOR95_08420 [Sutterella sp.]|nr:hypothetical protein [Sutterella sp.]